MNSIQKQDNTNNDNTNISGGNAEAVLLSFLLQRGLPVYPRFGTYNLGTWEVLTGKTSDTLGKWIKKYNIPCRKPGNEILMDAEDFHKHVPYEEITDGA